MRNPRLAVAGAVVRSTVIVLATLVVGACSDDSDGGAPETTTTLFESTTRPPTTTTVTTSTTVSSTTTSVTRSTLGGVTTTSIIVDCGVGFVVTFGVTNSETLGALQFDVDYGAADGSFDGAGGTVNCRRLAGDFAAFNDEDEAKTLSLAFVSTAGFMGPIEIADCDFSCPITLAPGDFVVTITDQSKPDFAPANAIVAVTRVESTFPQGTTTSVPATTTTTVPG